jgi:transposase
MSKMETVANKQPRPRPSFTPEFKTDIVERCLADDRTIEQVRPDFDPGESSVPHSVEQATQAGEMADQRRAGGAAAVAAA